MPRGSSTDRGDRNSGGDGDGTGEIGRRCGAARTEREREGNRSVMLHLALERTGAGEEIDGGGRKVELVDEMADSGGGGVFSSRIPATWVGDKAGAQRGR